MVNRYWILTALQMVSSICFGQERININKGHTRLIAIKGRVEKIELSKDGVISVSRSPDPKKIKIIAHKHGSVDLRLRTHSGTVSSYSISSVDPEVRSREISAIRSTLSRFPSIKIARREGQVVLSGKTMGTVQAQAVDSLKKAHPELIVDATERSIPTGNAVLNTINRVLSENDITSVRARSYGPFMVLEGTPKDEYEKELALRIARAMSPAIEDRISKLGSGGSSINIEVMFVEVEKKEGTQIGMGASASRSSDSARPNSAIGSASISGVSGKAGRLNWQIASLDSFLNMLQTTSSSRVLSNPQIVGRSGEEAKFHSGGTAYFAVDVPDNNNVMRTSFKEIDYGIELVVKPIIDRVGNIDSRIETRVSELAATVAKQQVADLLKTHLKTSVTIQSGESILLSGIINRRQRKTVDKVPLLGDVPILGELFKSRAQNFEEKELMILVTMNRFVQEKGGTHAGARLWEKAAKDVEFSIFD